MASAPSFHPVQPFLDAIPVDLPFVVGRAISYRRQNYPAVTAMKWAREEERAIAMCEASRAYQASLDPVTREIEALETRMYVLRERVLGKIGYARDRDYQEMANITARLAALQPVEFMQAAE